MSMLYVHGNTIRTWIYILQVSGTITLNATLDDTTCSATA